MRDHSGHRVVRHIGIETDVIDVIDVIGVIGVVIIGVVIIVIVRSPTRRPRTRP
nr:hypothetical protein SBE_004956 [Streptomyces sp. SBE_14.2]